MPPTKLLFDLASIDPGRVVLSKDEIRSLNPQRFEFEQLDRVTHFDPEERIIVGVRELHPDEFWVRGHMPGRPIFPGVLMLESAAQLCSVYHTKTLGPTGIFAFGGADEVRFRRMLTVGDELVLVAQAQSLSPRRSRFQTQGFSAGQLAFEAIILGVAVPEASVKVSER